jgi:hypothetical protein
VIPLIQPAQIGEALPTHMQGVAGNTEGKIRGNTIPRNDSRVETPWMESYGFHNTPALNFAYGLGFLHLWIRRR